jgi:ribosomal RNA-processing protein 1
MKLWKGLFYCMWMSDKPLIQEDLAETISELVHSIIDRKTGLKFITVALKTMANHWSGIDTWRMVKFLMVSFFYSRFCYSCVFLIIFVF